MTPEEISQFDERLVQVKRVIDLAKEQVERARAVAEAERRLDAGAGINVYMAEDASWGSIIIDVPNNQPSGLGSVLVKLDPEDFALIREAVSKALTLAGQRAARTLAITKGSVAL